MSMHMTWGKNKIDSCLHATQLKVKD